MRCQREMKKEESYKNEREANKIENNEENMGK